MQRRSPTCKAHNFVWHLYSFSLFFLGAGTFLKNAFCQWVELFRVALNFFTVSLQILQLLGPFLQLFSHLVVIGVVTALFHLVHHEPRGESRRVGAVIGAGIRADQIVCVHVAIQVSSFVVAVVVTAGLFWSYWPYFLRSWIFGRGRNRLAPAASHNSRCRGENLLFLFGG